MHAEERSATELIGRARELDSIARALERSRKDGVPLVIGIEGEPGIGKSTLLHAAAAHARGDKWIVATATCYAVQQPIPLTVVRQLLRSLLEAIGDERARYATGLQAVLESPKPESAAHAFARLLEGVTLDRPVVLALDDAQWGDRDSLQLLDETMASLGDRAVAALYATRSREEYATPKPEIVVPLQPLDEAAASAVARHLLPEVSDEIVGAVVNHARGSPLDIVALSTAIARVDRPSVDDVASSRRSAIARDVQAASPDLREFLQVCSLIDGPVRYYALEQLWPQPEKLDALVRSAVGRYLRVTELGIEFDHALIAEGIRHTIAVPIPYRRRIVAALERLESPALEDLQILASQKAECGDRVGAFNVLADVAQKAAASGQTRLTASASARALTFAEPSSDVARTFFPDYADALFALDRDSEAIAVLERALRLFDAAGTGIPGAAIGRLMLAQSFNDQLTSAESTYARFLPLMNGDAERAHVISAAIWFAACRADMELADDLEEQLLKCTCELPLSAKIRMRNFRAFVLAQRGRHNEAMALLDEAAAIVNEATLLGHVGISTNQRDWPRLLLSLFEYGTRILEPLVGERLRNFGDIGVTPAGEYFLALSEFLGGSWDRVEMRIAETLDHNVSPTGRRRFFSLAAAIAALRHSNSPYSKGIETDVAAFLAGRREGWYVPLAAWWAVATAQSEPKTARTVLAHLLSQLDKAGDPHVYLPRLVLVLLAHRLRDDASLVLLASHAGYKPDMPWHRVHDNLARGIAACLLGRHPDVEMSTTVAHARELGLNVYADLAATMQSKTDALASSRLSALGIKWSGTAKPVKDVFLKPTARELQVAALVAEGKSNQQIADELVLSQRTVEVHISNLFNKIGATSRTQLATWFVRLDAGN
ncbi:MAG TPA: AAA family ATPase [Candidatus Baltobacteraceae bacterium]|jgi:DNA-binding CsgD family transcriptional regulator/tetratricopeptide (TPR) repeat protein